MRRLLCATVLAACLALTACLASACAEPPNKEINQAQGAIDAARAAGADRYATDELKAALASLDQSNTAVTGRDYRLALNYALESRQHARNAARDAAGNRARLRAEVERTLAEIAVLAAQADGRIAAAPRGGVARPTMQSARRAIGQVNAAVQKAGAAAKADDYVAAQAALAGTKERAEQAIASLDAPGRSQSLRRQR
jgi:hypothetical protein